MTHRTIQQLFDLKGKTEARRDIRAAGSEINAWGLLFHAAKGNCTV